MNRESVQHERGPRTATIRRQVGELMAERERKVETNNTTLPTTSFQDLAFNLPFYTFPTPSKPKNQASDQHFLGVVFLSKM